MSLEKVSKLKKDAALFCTASRGDPSYDLMKNVKSMCQWFPFVSFRRRVLLLTVQRCGDVAQWERTETAGMQPGIFSQIFQYFWLKSLKAKTLYVFSGVPECRFETGSSRGRGKKNAALVCAARFPVYNLMKSFESVVNLAASFSLRRRCFWLTLQKCGRLYHLQRTKNGICWAVYLWLPASKQPVSELKTHSRRLCYTTKSL